jgi:tetratricopeptide (TPR) repeat protein
VRSSEKSFKKCSFSKAIEIYENLIQIEKLKNLYIYYSLASTYYRNGNLGRAVLNMEKAYRLAPRDREIKNNR